jgi:hypothetical protein
MGSRLDVPAGPPKWSKPESVNTDTRPAIEATPTACERVTPGGQAFGGWVAVLRRQLRQGASRRDGVGVVGAEGAPADGEGVDHLPTTPDCAH